MVRRITGRNWLFILTGIILATLLIFAANKAVVYTSTDAFCNRCHVHPHSQQSWIRSTHYDNQRGVIVHCTECHLPPHGQGYLIEKIKTGTRDVYSTLFKDISKINWEEKSRPEIAVRHTYLSACLDCHKNLFTTGLSKEGEDAHLYYKQSGGDVHCINCHLQVGHYSENVIHAKNVNFGMKEKPDTMYDKPALVKNFENFTEYIPGTGVSFRMAAIPGGTFLMGSPVEEPFRNVDEGPQREVSLKSFFIGRAEVTWDEYLAFFSAMGMEGRSSDAYLNSLNATDIDAITGPTPPWGAPDQGWGTGNNPAITMSFHAAKIYCMWLSKVTGKKYRLPTEAEWEYAARGGTDGPYFFEGSPEDFDKNRYKNKLSATDTAGIVAYVNYNLKSMGRTVSSDKLKENSFGLANMPGNVAEFCQDWYSADTYSKYEPGVVDNPTGPATGTEHVIRGGSFRSETGDVRCASRSMTRTDAWLKTDPQIPKSIWWYSDCIHVGFRVVCEWDSLDEE